MDTKTETLKVFVVTNGEVGIGSIPEMTEKLTSQIARISIWGILKIFCPNLVLIGTTKRFMETYEPLEPVLQESPINQFSKEKIIKSDYWNWMEGSPQDTLICVGEEFLRALNLSDIYKEGSLIEISIRIKMARQILVQSKIKTLLTSLQWFSKRLANPNFL